MRGKSNGKKKITSTGVEINHKYGEHRPEDLPKSYANADKAYEKLEWKAEKSLGDICRDTWNWQSKNPKGYKGE